MASLVAYSIITALGLATSTRADVLFWGRAPLAIAALTLAAMTMLRSPTADRAVRLFIIGFATIGLLTVIGPIYQWLVRDESGNRILIDLGTFVPAVISELLLLFAAVAFVARRPP